MTSVRSSLLLLRFPGVFVAVAGAALVIGLSAASGGLFLSSVGTAAFHRGVADVTPYAAGLTVGSDGPIAPDRVEFRARLFRDATEGIGGLTRTVTSIVGPAIEVARADRPGDTMTIRPATRAGFADHVERVGEGDGRGWWVPDSVAEGLGIRSGDRIRISRPGTGLFEEVRVGRIYRDLASGSPAPFWSPLSEFVYPSTLGGAEFPPPFLLAELDDFLDLESTFVDGGHMEWVAPADVAGLTLTDAKRLATELRRIEAALDDPSTQLVASFNQHATSLPNIVEQADATVAALSGPVHAVALAGRAVAMAVLVAAAIYALHRRRVEFATLQARGAATSALAVRSVVEAVVPATVGVLAGWGAAILLVRLAGPSKLVTTQAVVSALIDSVVTLAVALVLLGAAVGIALRAPAERRPGRLRRIAARLPWEALVLAAAGAAFYEIRLRGATPIDPSAEAPGVDMLVPLFPILLVAGVSGLAVRGLRRLMPRAREATRRWPAPFYLAGGRLAAAPRLALLLVTFSSLAVGIVAYAGVFVSSVRATASEKTLVSVGSDAALVLPGPPSLPADLGGPATEVARIQAAQVSPATNVVILVIDPATFVRAAFWDPGFADVPLAELLQRLSGGNGGSLPVLVTGGDLPLDPTLQIIGGTIPAVVVAETSGFPGMLPDTPLVVAAREAFLEAIGSRGLSLVDLNAVHQLWVRGDPEPVIQALAAAPIFPSAVLTADAVANTPRFLALSWLFGFLEALGVLAGLLALVALVLYVESRQRTREVSYVLSSRMGLSRAAHWVSVSIELGAMLLVSFAMGAVLAAAAAFVVHQDVDPLPQQPPAALFRVPAALFGLVAAALAAFALATAWVVQRRADRANVAEVMRLAG
ncbi:MAG: FtsX-like permease family protein [Actinomycetota bacterium]